MSLTTRVGDLATRIGTEFKTVYSRIGSLASLTTTDKTNLVAAINEVRSTAGAQINDTTASTTTVYSSSRVDTLLGGKQDSDADLSAIAAITGTGLLSRTGTHTWALDTTAYLAASAYTAQDVLDKIKTVDGSGSGLDADTLDGQSASAFAASDHNHNGVYLAVSEKGAANGVATLDANSKIPTSQLPSLAISSTFVVASQSAMLDLEAQEGDVAIRTDVSKSFILSSNSPSTLADWKELATPADAVTSVDGRTGTVSLSDLYAAKALETNVGDTTTNFVTVFEAALV